jgi:hypothetical protein
LGNENLIGEKKMGLVVSLNANHFIIYEWVKFPTCKNKDAWNFGESRAGWSLRQIRRPPKAPNLKILIEIYF